MDDINTKASVDEIDGARAYDNLHVPALLQQWAPLMVEAADIGSGDSVLDVACGTGILAREVAKQVGDRGSVSGLDASAGMLAVARQLEPLIEWREGIAESLPYEDNSFDAVVSQFGLMFFQNRPVALSEMLRVLQPKGRMAIAVWESLDKSLAYPLIVAMIERLAGPDAANALRAPFVLGETEKLLTLFQQARAHSVRIKSHVGKAQFPSIKSLVEADLRGWLPIMNVYLDENLIQSILVEAEIVLGQYVTQDGTVEFEMPAHIITAIKSAHCG
ncbi:MAG: ubiquinone/menaquinone biosynthesis C-methylase UbiE [Parasphingorhabdus sp.]